MAFKLICVLVGLVYKESQSLYNSLSLYDWLFETAVKLLIHYTFFMRKVQFVIEVIILYFIFYNFNIQGHGASIALELLHCCKHCVLVLSTQNYMEAEDLLGLFKIQREGFSLLLPQCRRRLAFGVLRIRAFRTSESEYFSEVRVRNFRSLKTLRTGTQRVC
jgi:hypothetical protein